MVIRKNYTYLNNQYYYISLYNNIIIINNLYEYKSF